MMMEKCNEWLDSVGIGKFGKLTPREELILLEYSAWLNEQSVKPVDEVMREYKSEDCGCIPVLGIMCKMHESTQIKRR